MGDVVSFLAYAEDRDLVVMNQPCERPFHFDAYVTSLNHGDPVCLRCNIEVVPQDHPSFTDGPRWYG